jgi:hypothetical protein
MELEELKVYNQAIVLGEKVWRIVLRWGSLKKIQ